MISGLFYRMLMQLTHRFNWHYMPPSYPENDTVLWCHWCGVRVTVHKGNPGICDDNPKATMPSDNNERK